MNKRSGNIESLYFDFKKSRKRLNEDDASDSNVIQEIVSSSEVSLSSKLLQHLILEESTDSSDFVDCLSQYESFLRSYKIQQDQSLIQAMMIAAKDKPPIIRSFAAPVVLEFERNRKRLKDNDTPLPVADRRKIRSRNQPDTAKDKLKKEETYVIPEVTTEADDLQSLQTQTNQNNIGNNTFIFTSEYQCPLVIYEGSIAEGDEEGNGKQSIMIPLKSDYGQHHDQIYLSDQNGQNQILNLTPVTSEERRQILELISAQELSCNVLSQSQIKALQTIGVVKHPKLN